MDIHELSVIYEEIGDKNREYIKELPPLPNLEVGLICLYEDENCKSLVDCSIIRRCRKRNICRIYNLQQETFEESIWLDHICSFLPSFLPSDCVLWYCTDDTEIPLECGFSNPYFCSYDPFGVSVTQKIALSKLNDPMFQTNIRNRYTGNDVDHRVFQNRRTSPTIENKSLFNYCTKHMDDNEITLDIRFDQDDLIYLRSLIYGGRTVNEDGSISQKEVSGTLHLEYNGKDFDLKLDNTKNFNAHDEESVRFVHGLVNFHTHPLDVYNNYEVELMYPSPADYISILIFLLQKYPFEDMECVISPLLFSCVITVEGIYIISLNKNYCSQEDKEYLRNMICVKSYGIYDLKQSVKDSINSKKDGISGFIYGKGNNYRQFYDTDSKYIGDPLDHPLGYKQVGGFDYDTTKQNRKEDQLTHFPEVFEENGFEYNRSEQAAKDYCLKINRRELVTDVKFKKGPVLHVKFMTYEEAESNNMKIHANKISTKHLPSQLLLSQDIIDNLNIFLNHKYQQEK